jgi:carbonic anhydrase/acetyltransferase-like protein (isoleucine patch superfamily)
MVYRFDGNAPAIGDGTYVSETAIVIGDVRIGARCYIGHGAVLRGDYGTIEIGDETTVEEGVVIHAPPQERCSIGNRVVLGHGAIIHARSIGDCVTVGMGAICSIRSEIGEDCIVAEGAVVKRGQHIPRSVVAGGNPARKIREVSAEEKEYGSWVTRLYTDLAGKYNDIGMESIDVENRGEAARTPPGRDSRKGRRGGNT